MRPNGWAETASCLSALRARHSVPKWQSLSPGSVVEADGHERGVMPQVRSTRTRTSPQVVRSRSCGHGRQTVGDARVSPISGETGHDAATHSVLCTLHICSCENSPVDQQRLACLNFQILPVFSCVACFRASILDNVVPDSTVEGRSAGSHDVADAKVVRFAGWLLVAVLPCIFPGMARMLPTSALPF